MGSPSAGSAYIFKKMEILGLNNKNLLNSDGNSYDFFGRFVSLYEDYALIGAYGDDDNGSDSGSAYILKEMALLGLNNKNLLLQMVIHIIILVIQLASIKIML